MELIQSGRHDTHTDRRPRSQPVDAGAPQPQPGRPGYGGRRPGSLTLNLLSPTLGYAAPVGQAAAAQPDLRRHRQRQGVHGGSDRGYQLKLTTLRVYLNGKEITSGVSIDRCVLTVV